MQVQFPPHVWKATNRCVSHADALSSLFRAPFLHENHASKNEHAYQDGSKGLSRTKGLQGDSWGEKGSEGGWAASPWLRKTLTQPVLVSNWESDSKQRGHQPTLHAPGAGADPTFRGARAGGVRGVAAHAAVQGAPEAAALEHRQGEPPHAGLVVELPALRHGAALGVRCALLAHEARVDP